MNKRLLKVLGIVFGLLLTFSVIHVQPALAWSDGLHIDDITGNQYDIQGNLNAVIGHQYNFSLISNGGVNRMDLNIAAVSAPGGWSPMQNYLWTSTDGPAASCSWSTTTRVICTMPTGHVMYGMGFWAQANSAFIGGSIIGRTPTVYTRSYNIN